MKILAFILSLCVLTLPLSADSFIVGKGCSSGKCPGGGAYTALSESSIKFDKNGVADLRIPTLYETGRPADKAVMSAKELNALKAGIKAEAKKARTVWYKGKLLLDPKNPNCCKPLENCYLYPDSNALDKGLRPHPKELTRGCHGHKHSGHCHLRHGRSHHLHHDLRFYTVPHGHPYIEPGIVIIF